MGQVHCECLRRDTAAEHLQLDESQPSLTDLDHKEALRIFRARGSVFVAESSGADGEPLWSAACDFVDAIILGVKAHLPAVRARAEVHGLPTAAGVCRANKADELLSISVRLNPSPIVGEVATPSRFCHEIRLLEQVRFALKLSTDGSSVILHVQGLELPPLSEVRGLRERMKAELGSSFSPETTFKWWITNKDALYPLRTSKFHRMYESLWGTPATRMLPNSYKVDYLWGYLHGVQCHLEAFIFQREGRSSDVRVTALRKPGQTEVERELLKVSVPLAHKQLISNRASGEKFATSVINFAAMIYGHDVGQPGASAKVMTKIFTGASWWGPGPNGFQQYDPTWLCRDYRNSIGIVTHEQGRVIWRVADGPMPTNVVPKPPPQRRRWGCCSRRAAANETRSEAFMQMLKHGF